MTDQVRGIVFDLGGTLMTFAGNWEDVEQQGAARMAAFFTRHRVAVDEGVLAERFLSFREISFERSARTNREVPSADALRLALDAVDAPPAAFPLIPEALRVYFALEEAAWQAFPESKDTLRQLGECAGGSGPAYRLGVLSNATDDPLIQRLVNRMELRPWLAPVWTSAALGCRKPLREPFDALLARWELPPESVIVVGDRLNADILGAHNAGMRGVLVTADEAPDNGQYRDTIIPDATIGRIGDLPALLTAWRRS